MKAHLHQHENAPKTASVSVWSMSVHICVTDGKIITQHNTEFMYRYQSLMKLKFYSITVCNVIG